MRSLRFAGPVDVGWRRKMFDSFGKGIGCRVDGEARTIDPSEFIRVGMDMDKGLPGVGNVHQRIAGGGHFAETPANQQQHIRLFHAGGEGRIDADADIARIIRMQMVEQHLPTKGTADGQMPFFGKACDRMDRAFIPARAAEDHEGLFCALQQIGKLFDTGG